MNWKSSNNRLLNNLKEIFGFSCFTLVKIWLELIEIMKNKAYTGRIIIICWFIAIILVIGRFFFNNWTSWLIVSIFIVWIFIFISTWHIITFYILYSQKRNYFYFNEINSFIVWLFSKIIIPSLIFYLFFQSLFIFIQLYYFEVHSFKNIEVLRLWWMTLLLIFLNNFKIKWFKYIFNLTVLFIIITLIPSLSIFNNTKLILFWSDFNVK